MTTGNRKTRQLRLAQEIGFVGHIAGSGARSSDSTLSGEAGAGEMVDRYCLQLSRRLNASGWDMRRTLKDDVSLQWNPALVKRYLWGDLQRELFGRRSLEQLNEQEVAEIYQILHSYLQGTGQSRQQVLGQVMAPLRKLRARHLARYGPRGEPLL